MTLTSTPKTPAVGMEATYGIGSDRYPYIIISTTPATFKMVPAEKADDGQWTAKKNIAPTTVTRRRDGSYNTKGSNSGYVTIGKATSYLDPSF